MGALNEMQKKIKVGHKSPFGVMARSTTIGTAWCGGVADDQQGAGMRAHVFWREQFCAWIEFGNNIDAGYSIRGGYLSLVGSVASGKVFMGAAPALRIILITAQRRCRGRCHRQGHPSPRTKVDPFQEPGPRARGQLVGGIHKRKFT